MTNPPPKDGLALPPPSLQLHTSRISLRDHSLASTATALNGNGYGNGNGNGSGRHAKSPSASGAHIRIPTTSSEPQTPPAPKPAAPGNHARFTWHRDVREYLPSPIHRFLGYRPPGSKAPFPPLPFPPFSWIAKLPLKYEVWLLSCIASFVGIALIEIVMIAGFPDDGTIMIIASFGASAVLAFAAIDSPLSQPRHMVGGQIVSALVGVAITRCFRHATGYRLDETTVSGGLGHVVWINGALAMAAALFAMQITGTTHPPGGATALISAVMPAGVAMSWRLVYLAIISSLLMLGCAMIFNNVGRRRYPTYWLSGNLLFVKVTHDRISQDELHMAAVEGRSDGFAAMDRAISDPAWNEKRGRLSFSGPGADMDMDREREDRERDRGRGRDRDRGVAAVTQDEAHMAAVEGRNDGFAQMDRALSTRS